jgi:predicted transcriptional regulator
MEVPLTPDLQAKLNRLASQQGRASESLAMEAIERMVNFDSYFLSEVEEEIAAADRDELVAHDEVGKLINQRYPG